MSVANLSLQNLWANQLASLNGSSASSSIGGSSAASNPLFANLIGALNGQSALGSGGLLGGAASTSSVASAANAASASTSSASSAKIQQDLDAFLQSLQQALALAQNNTNPAVVPGSSAAGTSAAGTAHHAHHGHGQGLNSLLQELGSTLSGTSGSTASSTGSSNSSSGGALTNLNSAFNQLMSDLGVAASASTSGQVINTAA